MHNHAVKILCAALALLLLGGCTLPALPSEPARGTMPAPAPTEMTAAPTETLPSEPSAAEGTAPQDDDFVRVIDFIPDAQQDLRYATADNFTGAVIYDFADAYLRYGTVKKLRDACDALAEHGLGIRIWDAFRPLRAQARLWEVYPDPAFVSPPDTGNRSHCRGSAIDLTLIDLATGEPLPMPTPFDDFTSLADRDYTDCGAEEAENARLLEDVMQAHGFRPYSREWWHFADETEYPVDDVFSPGTPARWVADCDKYITLRAAPDTGAEALIRIPRGGEVTLLGWEGRFARVRFNGRDGYVLASYIRPRADADCFPLPDDSASYSYAQLLGDLQSLADTYPDSAVLSVAGLSGEGREIPVLRLGRADAPNHILLQGAMHGREHMTSWLLTALAHDWLNGGIPDDVCVHILPMVNPDGVTVSQTGTLGTVQRDIYDADCAAGYTAEAPAAYAARWKANAEGVDINRNFPTGWESLDGREAPSSELYPGSEPFSCAEARVLRDYTDDFPFCATLSFHASGSTLYYGTSESLAETVRAVTGYTLADDEDCRAGYRDWAEDCGIPSVTVEIGCLDAPLDVRECRSILVRCRALLTVLAAWSRG